MNTDTVDYKYALESLVNRLIIAHAPSNNIEVYTSLSPHMGLLLLAKHICYETSLAMLPFNYRDKIAFVAQSVISTADADCDMWASHLAAVMHVDGNISFEYGNGVIKRGTIVDTSPSVLVIDRSMIDSVDLINDGVPDDVIMKMDKIIKSYLQITG